MRTESFIQLLKMEMLGQATVLESARLKELVQENEDYAALYHEIFSRKSDKDETAETEAAYNRHLARMKRLGLL